MHFIDDRFMPGTTLPAIVVPDKGSRIDYLAGPCTSWGLARDPDLAR